MLLFIGLLAITVTTVVKGFGMILCCTKRNITLILNIAPGQWDEVNTYNGLHVCNKEAGHETTQLELCRAHTLCATIA